MLRYAVVFPIAAGKTAADVKRITAYFAANMSAYRKSRERLGVTVERTYLQASPAGTSLIGYGEGAHGFAKEAEMLVTSDLAIDQKFVKWIAEVHGVDLRKPPAGPPPETIGEWIDPLVAERREGLAFAAPLLPGKAKAIKAWAREAYVTRRDDLAQSRRALGNNVEVITLNPTPMGDFGVVYLEGNNPVEANRRFAASRTPYDSWFKQALKAYFPPEIDFNVPVPPVEQIWDYVAQPVMA